MNLGLIVEPTALPPFLFGFKLLQGVWSSLSWSGLGLWVLAVQLEAKKPVSTGLFFSVYKSDNVSLINLFKSLSKLPFKSGTILSTLFDLVIRTSLIK